MEWYLGVLKNYAVFRGRACRKEYWMFTLISTTIVILLGFLDGFITDYNILSMLYSLAVFIPCIAVAVRRLHDTDRSGWWALIGLIPLIGPIVLIIFLVQDGSASENQYGMSPKRGIA